MTDVPAADGTDRRFLRTLRLLTSADFKRVFADPCRAGGSGLTLLARPNGLGHPRLGLVIAKKHVKTAVARNRIKRQVRESFRLHRNDLDSLDVIVLARHDTVAHSVEELRATLDSQWRRLKKRCAKSSSA